eukprot:TRINITY_DN52503_c0_g1_i1.p1 TRINITY_DN52503_c0_g1~~TRINITY_DN52503_c0_g1_i1.p1  ORF type:complete len:118 (-),score=28.73 TRINITY_DN52503_c0_g1_i1:28-381(-)
MLRSLVGSEMCIRDRTHEVSANGFVRIAMASSSPYWFGAVSPEPSSRPSTPIPVKEMLGRARSATKRISMTEVKRRVSQYEEQHEQLAPVSYTHLTLPTKRIVEISGVGGELNKKRR